jgi:Flp pilus assembly protein TadD
LKLGRAAEALAELRRADKLSPGDPVILSHLGDALLASGKRAEAMQAFRAALTRLQPTPARDFSRRGSRKATAYDPPDRLPEPGDAKVRAELLQKLKALDSSP